MKTYQIENLLSLAATLGKISTNNPQQISIGLTKLQKLAVSLHKRYEAACSYQWADTDSYRATTNNLERRAKEVSKDLGLQSFELQHDPRGWPFKFKINGNERSIG